MFAEARATTTPGRPDGPTLCQGCNWRYRFVMRLQAALKLGTLLAGRVQAYRLAVARRGAGGFALAFSFAFTMHVVMLWIAIGGGLASLLDPSTRAAGDRDGRADGVNVETIDATEFENRFVSFKTGRDASDSDPTAAAEKSAPAPPMPPIIVPEAQQSPKVLTTESEVAMNSLPSPSPSQSAAPTAVAAPPLSAKEIDQIVSDAKREIGQAAATLSMAGSARLGEASPFVRGVLRILKQTMPKSNGMRGTVAIQLFVASNGDVEAVRLALSSGNPSLDKLVLETVGSTHLVPPGMDTPPRERLFKINYVYQ